MSSHSLGHDVFEHPRCGLVRVSTIAFDEPQDNSCSLTGVTYSAETIVFVGPHTRAKVGALIRYWSIDQARRRHVAILKRALRGRHTER